MFKKILALCSAGAAFALTVIPASAWFGPFGFGFRPFGFGFPFFGFGFPFFRFGFPFSFSSSFMSNFAFSSMFSGFGGFGGFW